jgi:16S rRNA U1498 N3-methylase RsmE
LRHKSGDKVHFTDGNGFFFICRIVDVSPKH